MHRSREIRELIVESVLVEELLDLLDDQPLFLVEGLEHQEISHCEYRDELRVELGRVDQEQIELLFGVLSLLEGDLLWEDFEDPELHLHENASQHL